MPPPVKSGPKKLPPWAWIVALGGGALIGLILWRHSSSGAPPAAGASQGFAGDGSGGGSGVGAGSPPSPLQPVSAPTASTITVGDVLSTMSDPTTTTNAAPLVLAAAAPEPSPVSVPSAPFVQEGTPYAVAPPLPTYNVSATTLPAFDLSKTTLPEFHLQTLPTPNISGTPHAYGGVLNPEG